MSCCGNPYYLPRITEPMSRPRRRRTEVPLALASDSQPQVTSPGRRPGPRAAQRARTAGMAAHGRRLTDHRDGLLFRRYHRDGDLHARGQLIERYLPLARSLVRRYDRGSESFEDLMQVASLGLVKAVDRFEPERGFSFSSYAVPTMLGELRRYFRDSGWALHVPRELQERVITVNAAVERLSGELGGLTDPRADRGRAETAGREGPGGDRRQRRVRHRLARHATPLQRRPKPDHRRNHRRDRPALRADRRRRVDRPRR